MDKMGTVSCHQNQGNKAFEGKKSVLSNGYIEQAATMKSNHTSNFM